MCNNYIMDSFTQSQLVNIGGSAAGGLDSVLVSLSGRVAGIPWDPYCQLARHGTPLLESSTCGRVALTI